MNRLKLYWQLTRFDKPIGILLLLWPTLSALWLATDGQPTIAMVAIFTLGTTLMRAAGCAINDYADQDFDRHVTRTAQRPLTTGKIKGREALLLAAALVALAFVLISGLNGLTQSLSVVALGLAASYPYTKRFFALPQAYLGIAFGFGIPMAYAATQNQVPALAWLLLVSNVFWSVAYDTAYAMVDRDDDIKIGIRTSALTFGRHDVLAIMLCYAVHLLIWGLVGWVCALGLWFGLGWMVAVGCAVYYYFLIRKREPSCCFQAFRQNTWLGCAIFIGIALHFALG